jgi:peptidoglycan hydrolase-like protein with peptidoglycan-binding domain
MPRKWAIFSMLIVFLISLSGCATARKQQDLEIQGLKNQILVLESQLQTKDEEINGLKETLESLSQEKQRVAKKKVVPEVKTRPNIKQIQIALKNAGYNPGVIDGKRGRQTRDAIRAFQGANNLKVDGKVGKKTWSLLNKYLYQKVK